MTLVILLAIGLVLSVRDVDTDSDSLVSAAQVSDADAASVPVLLYHGVVDKADGYNITKDTFRDQMVALYKAGYQTITLEQLDKFRKGEIQVPDKSFVLTFDDGRKDSYKPVDPILKQLNFHAVMFVIAARVDDTARGFYLSRNELLAMQDSGGWDIGAHAHNGHRMVTIDARGSQGHYYGNKQWLKESKRLETDQEYATRITTDLREARETIESMGVSLTSFAFPFGDYGQESLNYSGARSVMVDTSTKLYSLNFYQPWPNAPFNYNYPHDSGMAKRIEPASNWSGTQLVDQLNLGHEKQYPLTMQSFSEGQNWRSEYGVLAMRDSKLQTTAKGGTGSAAVLDGTKSWQNYTFETDGTWDKGESMTVMARYSDSDNYLALSLSAGMVTLRQKLDGHHSVLAQTPAEDIAPGQAFHVTIKVHSGEVIGVVNDIRTLSAQLQPGILDRGGIGFRTDDQKQDSSSLTVTKLSVTNN